MSGEVERPEPVLPTVNPGLEKPAPATSGMHPAVYIATWITMSSSVILFNKWILDTADFRMSCAQLHLFQTHVLTSYQTFPSSSQHGICFSLL